MFALQNLKTFLKDPKDIYLSMTTIQKLSEESEKDFRNY